MSYNNYIPTVWAEAINRELTKAHVFAANTNREYEGKVSRLGDSVRILGIGSPTVTTYDMNSKDNKFTGLADPETIEDTSTTLYIDKQSVFNYKVDDIDKRQAVGGIMEALSAETSEKVADEQDKAIASLSFDSLAVNMSKTPFQITASNILEKLIEAHTLLAENNVSRNTKVTVTLSPRVAMLYKQAMGIGRQTSYADDLLKKGIIDVFDGMEIKESNNVEHKNVYSNDVLGIQVKTDRAIAFASPMIHTEPYRPEKQFSDAIKGFVLYGTKIVRPKEMVIMNCYL